MSLHTLLTDAVTRSHSSVNPRYWYANVSETGSNKKLWQLDWPYHNRVRGKVQLGRIQSWPVQFLVDQRLAFVRRLAREWFLRVNWRTWAVDSVLGLEYYTLIHVLVCALPYYFRFVGFKLNNGGLPTLPYLWDPPRAIQETFNAAIHGSDFIIIVSVGEEWSRWGRWTPTHHTGAVFSV